MQFHQEKKYIEISADLDDYDQIVKSNKERLRLMNIQVKEDTNEMICQTEQHITFVPKEKQMKVLTEHINNFVDDVNTINKKSQNVLKQLINKIQKIVRDSLQEEAQVYGSFATGLNLPHSDIDLVIKCVNVSLIINYMRQLEQEMKKADFIQESKLICFTAIPVLKLRSTEQYLSKRIDISFQESKHNGLACVNLINQYLEQLPPLRKLTLVMKQFLVNANLMDPYQGGLSSYGLTLMITSFLQSKMGKYDSLGDMLIQLLYLYGCEVDYISKTIYAYYPNQMIDGYTIFFNTLTAQNRMPALVIQDPLNEKHNVGRPTYNIQAIKFIFSVGFANLIDYQASSLETFLRCGENVQSQLKSNISQIYSC